MGQYFFVLVNPCPIGKIMYESTKKDFRVGNFLKLIMRDIIDIEWHVALVSLSVT